MLAYVKDGKQKSGEVIGAVGLSLIVTCGDGIGRELVQEHEAADRDQFRAEWLKHSPAAGRPWQTEDGPVELFGG